MKSQTFVSVFVCLLLCLALVAEAQYTCNVAPAKPQDRRTNKNQLVVATFNAEWLFLNASQCPGKMCEWTNTAEAMDHLNVIATTLRELNADIINLCEVQDCNVLSVLVNAIGSSYGYKGYLVKGTDTATGQNVAIITKVDPSINMQRFQANGKDVTVEWPVSGSKCGYNQQGGYTTISKHYWTRFVINNIPLTMVGVHYLAVPTDPPRCAQREGQASVAAEIIAKEVIAAETEGILLGDINDFDGVILDIDNNVPTSRVLTILESQGLSSVAEAITNKSTRYSDFWDINGDCKMQIPQEVSTIDHILVTDGLAGSLQDAYYSHTYVKKCNPENYESDHWPVVAVFDLTALSKKYAYKQH